MMNTQKQITEFIVILEGTHTSATTRKTLKGALALAHRFEQRDNARSVLIERIDANDSGTTTTPIYRWTAETVGMFWSATLGQFVSIPEND